MEKGFARTMKVFVLIGCNKGVVNDVRVSLDKNTANNIEEELCEKYELPFDEDERVDYYFEHTDGTEVLHFVVETE